MLAKSQRLTTKAFNEVLAKGRVTHSTLFLIRSLSGNADIRLSAVAPQKIAKTAVLRNRIRRKIYKSAESIFPGLSEGLWLIVFSKKNIADVDNADIAADLREHISKGGLSRFN